MWPTRPAQTLRRHKLHRQYRLATADAIVYATALEHDADLLTCDSHIKNLPGVAYFKKTL
ncbi:MAG: PIN domain-containing protein [Proteobacteria bacterium]|nr:PIN domain-containing protein [Pseudomonadota bacterium]